MRDPTLYLAASWVSDPGAAPQGCENLFVLANAASGGVDWDAGGAAYEAALLTRLGLPAERVAFVIRRTPADLERLTGAIGGAIYGSRRTAASERCAARRTRSPACAGCGAWAGPHTPAAGCRSCS